MNNKNLKKNGFYLLLVALVLILFPNDIVAKSGQSGGDSCLSKVHVTWTPSDPLDIDDSFGLKVSVDEGTWKVYADHLDIDDPSELFKSNNNLKSNVTNNWQTVTSSSSYEISDKSLSSDGKYIVLFIKLSSTIKNDQGKTICKPGYFYLNKQKIGITSENGNKNKIGDGTGKWRTIKVSKYDDDLASGTNSSKKACELMRSGIYKNNGTSSSKDIQGGFNNSDYTTKMKNYFPYCWTDSDNSNIEFSNRTINEARQNFIDYYNTISKISFSSTTEINNYNQLLSNLSQSWIKKTVQGNENSGYSTNVGALQCSVQSSNNTEEKYYAEKTVLSNDYCSVKCTEQFTITYSPPVAVKSGLCFNYEVTVKSKVTCITEKNQNIPWPQNQVSTCKYKAVCDDGSDQAGPSSEFDSCIQKCDKGEYSQSCINKCYDKVYSNKSTSNENNKTTQVSVFENKGTVEFMADDKTNKPYKYYEKEDGTYFDLEDNCQTKKKLLNNLEMCAKGFKEAKDIKPMGTYTKDGKKYIWNPDPEVKTEGTDKFAGPNRKSGTNSVINSVKRAAPYYLRTVSATKTLLKSFFAIDTGKNGWGYDRYYNIDENGIKRQVAENWSCPENCWFKQSTNSAANCISTDEEAYEIYKKEISSKTKQIEDCAKTSAETCSTTEATFSIDVDNPKSNDNDDTKCVNSTKCDDDTKDGNTTRHCWNAANTKGNPPSALPSGDILIFTPVNGNSVADENKGINGKCYGIENTSYWHHYKTTITFPGSWINLKTGEVKYATPSETSIYREKTNYFCTLYNSCDINVDWWKWKINGTSLASSFNPTYNINSSIKDFGKYNWNVSLQCFYAAYNGSIGDTPSCYRGKNGEEEKCNQSEEMSTKLNYDIRVADTGNLFPNNRLRGYNWGSAAQLKSKDSAISTALKNKGYGVDPVNYSKVIQKQGEKVYTENDGNNYDLRVVLDADSVREIKKESLEFNGKYTKVDGIPGLYYYNMDDNLKSLANITTKWEKGENSKTAINTPNEVGDINE